MPEQDLKAALSELAYGCRILYTEGHANMTLGHLSLRDIGDFVLIDCDLPKGMK